MWEFDRNQIWEGGMLIDTETSRGRMHWWRRESQQKFESWESTVLGGAAFETQLTSGLLKSPNATQSDRREMMVSSVQIRDMLSGGGVLGLRYTTAIVGGSVLKSRSHTIRLT